jgi:pimeloyl-ACP methyl ester carboxylesterase
MDIVLIAGLWLPVSIWTEVVTELERLGHHPLPVRLPGVDDGDRDAALGDQLEAVLTVVDASDRPVVVGHSAGCTLAWMAADRRPEEVSSVVLIGGFPYGDGATYADFFPISEGAMPFPGWEPFEGPDAADLGETERSAMAAGAVPVPEAVATGTVTLSDERRFQVPVVLVCPEFDPDQARSWIDGGDVPELAKAESVSFVDIESGHWPMVTRPTELAGMIHTVANGNGV